MKLVNFFGYPTFRETIFRKNVVYSPLFYSISMEGKMLFPEVGSLITA